MAAIEVKRGDTWAWPFYVFSKDEDGNKSPVDLSGCAARLQVKPKKGDYVLYAASNPDPLDETINGQVTITEADGLVSVKFPATVTKGIAPGVYDSDLEITWADGSVQSSTTFTVTVNKDVTI